MCTLILFSRLWIVLVRLSLFVTVAPRSVQYGTALFRARVVWRAGSMCFGALPVPLCGVRALSAIMYKNVLRVYLYLLCGCRSPCCFILKIKTTFAKI